jgi:hypothetical protein
LSVSVGCGGKSAAPKQPVDKVAEPDEVKPDEVKPDEVKPDEPKEPPPPPEPDYMHGNFVWFELTAKDPAKAAAFYQSLFGWTSAESEIGGEKMTTIQNGERPIATVMAGKSAGWTGYISVENVDEAVLNTTSNEGSVVAPAADIPDVGRFAIVKDPDGAVIGLLKASKGDSFDGPATHDFFWSELWARKPADVVAFYEAVVDYTKQEVTYGKETSYRLVANKAPRGGIGKIRAGKAAQWIPYVLVDDVAATSKAATKLKAKVVVKPFVIFGVGRGTVLSDPSGAYFGLIDLTDKGEPAAPKGKAPADEEDEEGEDE